MCSCPQEVLQALREGTNSLLLVKEEGKWERAVQLLGEESREKCRGRRSPARSTEVPNFPFFVQKAAGQR